MVSLDIRNILRKSYLILSSVSKSFNNDVYFLYAHYISRENSDLNLAYDLLKRLSKHTAFLDFEEACEIVKNNTKIKYPAVCFSFDDGFFEVVNDICPMIQDLGASSCVFINPGFIDGDIKIQKTMCNERYHVIKKPASWNDLSVFIRQGGVIGSHTTDHVKLSGLNSHLTEQQIVNSKLIIESRLDTHCKYFAWPYGTAKDISDEALSMAVDNYDLVFSAIRGKNRHYKHDRVFNRDHFELNWSFNEVKYFLTKKKVY